MEYGTIKEERGIIAQRGYSVYKKNDLIQRSRFSLSLNQQKTLLYLVSKIQDTDCIDKVYKMTIGEYCEVAGIAPVDGYYSAVKADIRAIADASVWIKQPDGKEVLIRWLDIVKLDEGTSTIEVSFTKSIEPYLFFFTQDGHYTSYPLLYVLPMCCKYSIRLYELLKSYANTTELTLDIADLKIKLDAANEEEADYTRFVDFRRYVIDRAVNEVNQYTDIKVEYEQLKHGKKTIAIRFFITKKSYAEKRIADNVTKQKLKMPRITASPKATVTKKVKAIEKNYADIDKALDGISPARLIEQLKEKVSAYETVLQSIFPKMLEYGEEIANETGERSAEEAFSDMQKILRVLDKAGEGLQEVAANTRGLLDMMPETVRAGYMDTFTEIEEEIKRLTGKKK